MIGYVIIILYLVSGIAENRYVLLRINSETNLSKTIKHVRPGYMQMKIVRDYLPNRNDNWSSNKISNGVMPNSESILTKTSQFDLKDQFNERVIKNLTGNGA